jgi:hypothetical protein
MTRAIKTWWVCERHPKGGLSVLMLMESLERNFHRWKTQKTKAGWEILAIMPTQEDAREYERYLKREMKSKQTSGGADATGPSNGVVGQCVSCCGDAHEIIQWTDAGPRQYGAECSICGRRIAEETPTKLIAAFAAANAGREGSEA